MGHFAHAVRSWEYVDGAGPHQPAPAATESWRKVMADLVLGLLTALFSGFYSVGGDHDAAEEEQDEAQSEQSAEWATGPAQPGPFRVSVYAAPTLNAAGQPRVTLSLR